MFASVQLLDTPIASLTYQVPEELHHVVGRGYRVLVPVKRQYRVGIILDTSDTAPSLRGKVRIRKIKDVVDNYPLIPSDLMDFCQWVCGYYFYPLGLLLNSILPEMLRKKPRIFYRIIRAEKLSDQIKQIEGKEISRYTLIRKYGLKQPTLDRLEKKGFLKRIYKLPESGVARKTKYYRLLKNPSEAEDSKFNHVVFEAFSREGNILEHRQLRQLIGKNSYYWIKKWKHRGWIEEIIDEDTTFLESPFAQDIPRIIPQRLTRWQSNALREIEQAVNAKEFQPFLLFGVTGSGKTEIYLQICKQVLETSGSVLILVPEIALITQIEALFKNRFSGQVAVWHSGMNARMRYDQWLLIRRGQKRIVVGTRSAIFLPIQNCMLIVVDEEHDSSYKQEDRLRYSARDIAIKRARDLKVPIVLGSATPSIQSYYHATTGQYKLLVLPERIHSEEVQKDETMPLIEVVDMRNEPHGQIISRKLKDAITENLEKGFQSLLFLNRRGYSNCAICPRCGFVIKCEFCSVAMTYHISGDKLYCHYCGLQKSLPDICPSCEKSVLIRLGYGTEKVERRVKELFPYATVLRIDRDSVKSTADLVKKLNQIRKGEVHVIIGTQMMAKGHDFPLLNLTAIINADMSFNLPDFRADEITAQLIFQVSGRPGRGTESRGKVIIQTYTPNHYIFDALKQSKYEIFCDRELESRKILKYPPYNRMTRIICSHKNKDLIHRAVYEIADSVHRTTKGRGTIIGPAPAPLFKLKNIYRWQFIFKTKKPSDMTLLIESFLNDPVVKGWQQNIQIVVDRDPYLCL